jgi:hypothetical protein
MSTVVDVLLTGWRRRALWMIGVAAIVAGIAAGVVAGLAGAAGVTALWLGVVVAGLQQARLEGPVMRLRDWRSGFAVRSQHARSVDRLDYRRSPGPQRIRRLVSTAGIRVLLLGPAPSTPIFRAVALWLIVHGRRQARIDPALLDALASVPVQADAGRPQGTRHA